MDTGLPKQVIELVEKAMEQEASDLYLVPGEPPAMRIDGRLQRTEAPKLDAGKVKEMAAAIVGMEELDRIGPEVGERHRSYLLPGNRNVRFGVARSGGDYSIVAALVGFELPSVEQLDMPRAILEAAHAPYGLVLFSGPAGSGKITSMLSVLDHLNAAGPVHICTVEDPMHWRLAPKKAIVQQREVGRDVPNCLSGIHAAMQQDLDILMVGEIKTVEELTACITTAETGHLVLSQLHAHSAAGAVERIMDVFPPDMQELSRRAFAQSLRVVSCQRLLPKAGGKGRVAVFDIVTPDDAIRDAIATGRPILSDDAPLPEGCLRMTDHIQQLERDGVIATEVAERALAEIRAGR